MKRMLRTNLKFFNAGDAGGTPPGGDPSVNPGGNDGGQEKEPGQEDGKEDQKEPPKTLTAEEIEKLLADRLKQEKSAWEKEITENLKKAQTEAEKMAKMNAEEKAEYERKQKEESLAKREAEITRRELRAQALETLTEKGLPKELVDMVNYADADSCKASIDTLTQIYNIAVEKGVNERLKGKPPITPGTPKGATEADKLEEARTDNDLVSAVAIKRLAAQQGKILY